MIGSPTSPFVGMNDILQAGIGYTTEQARDAALTVADNLGATSECADALAIIFGIERA